MYSVYGGFNIAKTQRTLEGESLHLAVTKDSESIEPPCPPDDILRMSPTYLYGLSLTGKEWRKCFWISFWQLLKPTKVMFDLDCTKATRRIKQWWTTLSRERGEGLSSVCLVSFSP
jgi:hypothetical protein